MSHLRYEWKDECVKIPCFCKPSPFLTTAEVNKYNNIINIKMITELCRNISRSKIYPKIFPLFSLSLSLFYLFVSLSPYITVNIGLIQNFASFRYLSMQHYAICFIRINLPFAQEIQVNNFPFGALDTSLINNVLLKIPN